MKIAFLFVLADICYTIFLSSNNSKNYTLLHFSCWVSKICLFLCVGLSEEESFGAKYQKNQQIDSGPVPDYTLTKNSLQEITKSEDTCYPLHHTGKSLKLDFIHRKDFIFLVVVLFLIKC